ncbi:hypothetical protein NEIFLAOT_00005 [Neisseria flavescens NRL30031/H210]|uniref:Uncharacterized protein n=1 Tax=Neisseria flavescens NRL30031/H210 TaxID=546264 RepID=C0EJB7_NEIFL|nr:hypothetical protein NEIFLAOT_00005 [Neisseria flavescens NRL30031/H210]
MYAQVGKPSIKPFLSILALTYVDIINFDVKQFRLKKDWIKRPCLL